MSHLIRLETQIQLDPDVCSYEFGYYNIDLLEDMETTELDKKAKGQKSMLLME